MGHHSGRGDELERWEEERRYQLSMETARQASLAESHSPLGVPLSVCTPQPSGAPSLSGTDESSEGSRDDLWNNNSRHSSSSTRKIPSVSEFSPSMPPPPPRPSQSMIEISPGVHVRLRGADETWKAIEQDSYMPAECLCCETTIFCIQNADYILCPDCRVVSRMEGSSSRGMGGVGLGFKYDDLARWQGDISRARQEEAQQKTQSSIPRGGWS
jgi:hypothetical protein